jgi:hypothetical protein
MRMNLYAPWQAGCFVILSCQCDTLQYLNGLDLTIRPSFAVLRALGERLGQLAKELEKVCAEKLKVSESGKIAVVELLPQAPSSPLLTIRSYGQFSAEFSFGMNT